MQLAGYINDWYHIHGKQKKEEKLVERILVESDTALGTTVRVAGSYYNELTAINFALMWVTVQLIFMCYWAILGHTMNQAAHRCIQDNEKPQHLVMPRNDPLNQEFLMVTLTEAKKLTHPEGADES